MTRRLADIPSARLDVSRETSDRLRCFAGLLDRWSSVLNLTSRKSAGDMWARHFADSVQLSRLIPPGVTSFVDVGSGAGFPGIPLAIVSGLFVHLVEADHRKAAFLQTALAELEIPGTVWNDRVERVSLERQTLCTARAVAPLGFLISLCRPLMTDQGIGLFPKGRSYRSELAALSEDVAFQSEIQPSLTDPASAIIVVRFSTAPRAPV